MIEVRYRFGPGVDPNKHAKVIAIGQTAGSWSERHAHRAASLQSHLGQVLDVTDDTALVGFPEANVEGDIGTLLTMIFGKYSMAGAARVIEVRLPPGYGRPPRFGMDGLRGLLGAYGRPLVMGIFKPALGLTARDHADILREVADAGIDIVKDDEIHGDLPSAPTADRLAACREVIDAVHAETGREVMYAVNVTGPAHVLLDRAHRLVEAGANALLLNVLTHGWSVLEALADELEVPIFAHPALAGALCAGTHTGMAYSVVLGTLMAHAGADAVLYPAHYGSMPFDPAEEAAIRDELRERGVAPVPSAGITPAVVPRALADYGNDVVLNAGTGIMDHPDGPGPGVLAFFEALDRVRSGAPFTAADCPPGPLRRALEVWG